MTTYCFAVELAIYDENQNVPGERWLRFATDGFTTSAMCTPPNTYYEGRLEQALWIPRAMFAEGTTYGRSVATPGDLILANADAALDDLITAGFDGRRVIVRRGVKGAMYPDEWETVFVGTMEHPDFTPTSLVIRLRSLQYDLENAVLTSRYAGTNTNGNGVEGVTTDIRGQLKPRVLGDVLNIAPPAVNTARLVYQLSDSPVAVVHAVYDRGVALSLGAPYASLAECLAVSPPPSTARLYSGTEGAFIRLGSSPAGTVTVDASETLDPTDATIGQLFARALTRAGTARGDASLYTLRAGDLALADAQAPGPCGRWVTDDVSWASLFDEMAETLGGWWGFDAQGAVRFAQIAKPRGTPVRTITSDDFTPPLERLHTNDPASDLPVYEYRIRYAQNYTVQPATSLAGSVDEATRVARAQAFREVARTNAGVQPKHPLAVSIASTTWLQQLEDAEHEAMRRLNLRSRLRHIFELRVPLTDEFVALELGDIVGLLVNRYSLQLVGDEIGRLFYVTGIAPDANRELIRLTLWGSGFDTRNRITEAGALRVDETAAYRTTE